jgi:hypothetical protein
VLVLGLWLWHGCGLGSTCDGDVRRVYPGFSIMASALALTWTMAVMAVVAVGDAFLNYGSSWLAGLAYGPGALVGLHTDAGSCSCSAVPWPRARLLYWLPSDASPCLYLAYGSGMAVVWAPRAMVTCGRGLAFRRLLSCLVLALLTTASYFGPSCGYSLET